MSNHNKDHIRINAINKTRRESARLIKLANDQELVASGVEVIKRDTHPLLPFDPENLPKDSSKLFAVTATAKAFGTYNENRIYTKAPIPRFNVVFGAEHGSEEVEIDPDTEKARLIGDLSGAVASYGGSLAVIDMQTSIGSNRVSERDAAKLPSILTDPGTGMAVVLYPPEMPDRLNERTARIENVLATVQSNTPILKLVLPDMYPGVETQEHYEFDTATHTIPQQEQ